MVFGLPFHTARFFRPTLLEVFGFSNTQLGDLFAVYGITAMIAYFPGGALADRFSPRTLMCASLVATALGGLYMATIPGAAGMAALYGFWGVTTVLLFWGALIKATREWGGHGAQGRAFGILDAGRGAVAFAVAGVTVLLFASLMPEDAALASDAERLDGFRAVIYAYTVITLGTAALVWLLIPKSTTTSSAAQALSGMTVVLRQPVVWAQAAIIVCAYCGFKGLDYYSLYAVDVLDMNEVDAAKFATWGALVRPVGALAAGLLADRYGATRMIGASFVVLVLSYAPLSVLSPSAHGVALIYLNLFVTFFAVFALRGIYFALLEENRTPATITGAAVGMVSLIGYTPEIFFAPITGRILDANPGVVGHQNFFLFLTGVAALGVIIVALLVRLRRRGPAWPVTSEPATRSE